MKKRKKNSIVGAGLVALDVILNGNPETPPIYHAGGSCGNVLTILSYLNFDSYPVARLAANRAAEKLIADIQEWGVKTNLISTEATGSTPIIIQRMKYKNDGTITHKFEFRNPETGDYLPSYKPLLGTSVSQIIELQPKCDFFYFDRISRSTIDLALYYKQQGALIVFEPSSLKDPNEKQVLECVNIVDIIKFSRDRIADFRDKFPNGFGRIEIETLGNEGVNFRINKGSPGKWHHLMPFNIDKVKDAAGAGDWCTSGIIFAFSALKKPVYKITLSDWKNIINIGQAFGAISCFFTGARGMMYKVEARTTIKFINKLIADQCIKYQNVVKNTTNIFTRVESDSISSLL